MGNHQSSVSSPTGRTSSGTASLSSLSSAAAVANADNPSSAQIAQLIQYAASNYETNPTDSLLALMQALKLNSGQEAANQAVERIRAELGNDVAHHILDRQGRVERAKALVQEMVSDENTVLYQQGNQHILQQAMEDGSSVVCSKCQAMIPAARWQPHRDFWCQAIVDDDDGDDNDDDGGDEKEASPSCLADKQNSTKGSPPPATE